MFDENVPWRIHIWTDRKPAWGTTHLTKLNKAYTQQKHTVRNIYSIKINHDSEIM